MGVLSYRFRSNTERLGKFSSNGNWHTQETTPVSSHTTRISFRWQSEYCLCMLAKLTNIVPIRLIQNWLWVGVWHLVRCVSLTFCMCEPSRLLARMCAYCNFLCVCVCITPVQKPVERILAIFRYLKEIFYSFRKFFWCITSISTGQHDDFLKPSSVVLKKNRVQSNKVLIHPFQALYTTIQRLSTFRERSKALARNAPSTLRATWREWDN